MSTTTESQPQRAMLSADAELGIPSQPFTATPPLAQSVLSLFSRKALLPILLLSGAHNGPVRRAWPMEGRRLTPHARAADYEAPSWRARAGRCRFQK